MAKSNFLVAVVLFLCYVSVDNTEAVLPESCFTTQWPNFTSCVEYGIEGDSRYVHSNSLPPFSVAPYCPYGVGNGYCMKGETDCPFHGMVCPAQEGAPATGDIPVATRTTFNIPAKPDPTNPEKPLPMFHENDQKKWHQACGPLQAFRTATRRSRSGHHWSARDRCNTVWAKRGWWQQC